MKKIGELRYSFLGVAVVSITASVALIAFSNSLHAKAPQVAIDACQNKMSGSSCDFRSPRGDITGMCLKLPQESQLICVPSKALQGGQSGTQERMPNNRQTQNPPAQNPQPQTNSASSGGNSQTGNRPRTRIHTTIQSSGNIDVVKANQKPITSNQISIKIAGDERVISANGVSQHLTGNFPNSGNPHEITEQSYTYRVPAKPSISGKVTALGLHNFGIGVNGVPFDPGAAEWYQGERNSKWQYEAMSGAVRLGLDENHAHVQPQGAYHYHALPTLLLSNLGLNKNQHSPLVGWAADGFPIYAIYGYADPENTNSTIQSMTSSYKLKTGNRPAGGGNPGGQYDGTFIADYEFVQGAGSLDECNGKMTKTPEFPNGTYAYFLSESFPIIPRCYKGTPSTDFTSRR
jgi:hypothetical protein